MVPELRDSSWQVHMRSHAARSRRIAGAAAILAGMLFGFIGVMAVAQSPASPDEPAVELRAEASSAQALIGAPVLSADGAEVGAVSAVTVAENGQVTEIRLTTTSRLGADGRTVALAQGSFMTLDGAVVLDMSAAELEALPALRGTSA